MENDRKQDQPAAADGQTIARRDDDRDDRGGAPAPRLPHEHDESRDSQAGDSHEVIRQAHADIEDGLVDTDRHATPGVEKAVQGGKPNTSSKR